MKRETEVTASTWGEWSRRSALPRVFGGWCCAVPVTVMPNVKPQPDIREGDVCIRCGERVRPLLDDGAPEESGEGGATSVGWTCACVTIEGPQVPVDG